MAQQTWTFALEDGPHRVELEHNTTWGKIRVRIDGGEPLPLGRSRVRGLDGEYPMTVGGHAGVLYLRRNGLGHTYDLAIDGFSVTTGQTPVPPPPMPAWGWGFMALCAPLLIGGGLGAGLAVAGGLLCYSIARDPARPVPTRVLTCAGILAACWLFFLVVSVVVGAAFALHHR